MSTAQTTKPFRYQAYIDQLSVPCPPDDFEAMETIAFRWMFGDMGDDMNFMPQFFKNPKFANAPEAIRCQALGISFFISGQHGKARFEKLFSRIGPTAYETLGKNMAVGNLGPDDGLCNQPDSHGHFTFHPFEGSDFEHSFTIVAPL